MSEIVEVDDEYQDMIDSSVGDIQQKITEYKEMMAEYQQMVQQMKKLQNNIREREKTLQGLKEAINTRSNSLDNELDMVRKVLDVDEDMEYNPDKGAFVPEDYEGEDGGDDVDVLEDIDMPGGEDAPGTSIADVGVE